MYKEWLKLIDENWNTIHEKAVWMCREIHEAIDNEGNILSELEDEISYNNEFGIISLDCKFIKDEKDRIKRIEYSQEKVIPDLLTMFHEKLLDKASCEDTIED